MAEGGGQGGRRLERREVGRLVGVTALVVLAVVFVVQNLQTVTVHLWVTSSHTRLIWVIVGTLAVGIVLGYAASRAASRRQAGGGRRRRA